MAEYEVIFYETEGGKCPVAEFLDETEGKLAAKVVTDIKYLALVGPALREPHSKPLEDGIFELRTIQGSNIARVLYFFIVGGKIIMTNGFIKKSRKTPQEEISKAKKYRADYLRRCGTS